ncbi:alpha/beta fold hydrolase [Vreelandella rituensis]|uniref:Proline iminopeptidase n=1 Tax=Vreelandella rituensis TaxID=2282306 RepID=A0A368U940_9GAMM|nr:alpha/beta fold hydrolase [Halomonas rituensis]RCV93454.1 alpha/beta fold hydrolase [Halomonas rituensis]
MDFPPWQHGRSRSRLLAGALSLLFAPSLVYAQSAETGTIPLMESTDCPTEALRTLGAECYTFYGEENWDEPNGNIIRMPVAVIEPEGKKTDEVPVFFFPGGPGYSSLGNLDYLEQLRKDIGERTLVTMDHRGYIHSEPALECPDYAHVSPYHNIVHTPAITSSLDPMQRLESITRVVEDCYDKLEEEGIEVAQYNQYSVSRDVDEIRQLLDYEHIDAFGSSTGSGTVLSYIQYHPESVRAAIFGWPWFAHLRNRPPVDEFYTAKQTFNDVLALCVAEDPACRELLPAWLLSVDRARRTLDERPFVATVEDSDGREKTLYFDGAAFLDTLYLFLPSVYAELPSLVTDIQADDYSRLEDFFLIDDYNPEPEAPNYALGYFLAHVCNDMGSNRPSRDDSIAAVQREPAILGFEPPWVCGWWGEDGDVPPEHNDPPATDIPALAIHGQMDPCCGTRWSEHLKKTMPNLQFVEYQGLGHNPVNECRSAMVNAFLDDPHAEVDDSCKDEVELESWVIEPPQSQSSNR